MLCAHDETDRTNWVEAIRKVSSEGHSSAATPIVPLMQASAAAERGEWGIIGDLCVMEVVRSVQVD